MINLLKNKRKLICGISSLISLAVTVILLVFTYITYSNPHFYYSDNKYYDCYLKQFYGEYSREYSDYNSTFTSSAYNSYIDISVRTTYSSKISNYVVYWLNANYFEVKYAYVSSSGIWYCSFDITEYGIFSNSDSKANLTEDQIELAESYLKFTNSLIDSNIYGINVSYSITDVLLEYQNFVDKLSNTRTLLFVFDAIFALITLAAFILFIIKPKKKLNQNIDGGTEILTDEATADSVDSNDSNGTQIF